MLEQLYEKLSSHLQIKNLQPKLQCSMHTIEPSDLQP